MVAAAPASRVAEPIRVSVPGSAPAAGQPVATREPAGDVYLDTIVERLIQNAGAGLLVGDVTKIHGSETKAADFQAGAAKMRIVHKRLR